MPWYTYNTTKSKLQENLNDVEDSGKRVEFILGGDGRDIVIVAHRDEDED